MAQTVTIDSSEEYQGTGLATHTFAHTCSGNDRLLLVVVAVISGTTVSGVTYAGTAMANTDQAGSPNTMSVDNASDVTTYLWRLIAPATGTNNIVITLSGSASCLAVSSSWTGVHQTTALGTWASATGTSGTPSVDVSSASGEKVVDALGVRTPSVPFSMGPGALQTQIKSEIRPLELAIGSSYEAGAATVTMTWNNTSAAWATGGVAIKPAGDPTGTISATTISEMYIAPKRAAPGFSTISNASGQQIENQHYTWEASGMFPLIIVGTWEGGPIEQVVWDTIYTILSVAPGGAMAVTSIPAINSPDGSLVVSTQDALYNFALPPEIDTAIADYPQYPSAPTDATEAAAASSVAPTYYPSGVELPFDAELRFIEVEGRDLTREVDTIRAAFRWDETIGWHTFSPVQDNYAIFEVRDNRGRTLWTAFQLLDNDSTDPIGPRITAIDAWVKPLSPVDRLAQPDRTTPESS